MAREFPIHNGRMTTDLDANGHKIKNLPPGSGFTQVQSDWGQADATAPDFIKNKPPIPAPVTVDPSLSPTSENPVQNKAVAAALAGKQASLTQAQLSAIGSVVDERKTVVKFSNDVVGEYEVAGEITQSIRQAWESERGSAVKEVKLGNTVVSIGNSAFSGCTNLTSVTIPDRVTNIGHDAFSGCTNLTSVTIPDRVKNIKYSAFSGCTGLTSVVIPDSVTFIGVYAFYNCTSLESVTFRGRTLSAVEAMANYSWGISDTSIISTENNATKEGVDAALSQKASLTDLPYALVTPGEWAFSGDLTGFTDLSVYYDSDEGQWSLNYDQDGVPGQSDGVYGDGTELSVTFGYSGESWHITATRASLPGHLCDRANNLIDAQTGNVTLTLPAYQEGKVRDLLVHVNLGDDGTNPYTVTFAFPSGETNTGFKVKGNASAPLPAPDAAGEWLFSFSECAPHKMAVALAQLQDATAGGS